MNDERFFLDTTFIAGYLNPRDQHHAAAQRCMPLVKGAAEVVVTEVVLIEVGNLLRSTLHRQRAATFIDSCYSTRNITVVSVDTQLLKSAIHFYRQHSDKDWGLADCVSFVVMERRGLRSAISSDTDFQQAGLRALMLEV
jgi:predicted nucleic acid-binding protein